ncbi:MAG: ribosome maturation factor RimP [Deltaproteobacteria bacterium]|nr:ribosome maturation factor RimP [Candidatus Anaeroferrophillacea bacterium]
MGTPAARLHRVVESARQLAEPLIESLGFELVDCEYAGAGGRGVLRFYIDKPGGVTIDDCAAVSRQLGALLDVDDVVPSRYFLEVSSPGLERPVRKPRDFERFIGRRLRIRTRQPVDGRCRFAGELVAFNLERGLATVVVDGRSFALAIDNFARCNLIHDFDEG